MKISEFCRTNEIPTSTFNRWLLGDKIYIAYGITDFRKQISSLCNIVQNEFKMNPYDKSAYIFL